MPNDSDSSNPIMRLLESTSEDDQLNGLIGLCNIVNTASQRSLLFMRPTRFIPSLIVFIKKKNNPELAITAARALTYMIDAVSYTVKGLSEDHIRVLLSTLQDIDDIEFAEQVIMCIEKIAKEVPRTVLTNGGMSALLNFVDFFDIALQRSIVLTAAMISRKFKSSLYPLVESSLPHLREFLLNEDQKIQEGALSAISNMVYAAFNEGDGICVDNIFGDSAQAILEIISRPPSPNLFDSALRLLSVSVRASADVAERLARLGVIKILSTIYLENHQNFREATRTATGLQAEQEGELRSSNDINSANPVAKKTLKSSQIKEIINCITGFSPNTTKYRSSSSERDATGFTSTDFISFAHLAAEKKFKMRDVVRSGQGSCKNSLNSLAQDVHTVNNSTETDTELNKQDIRSESDDDFLKLNEEQYTEEEDSDEEEDDDRELNEEIEQDMAEQVLNVENRPQMHINCRFLLHHCDVCRSILTEPERWYRRNDSTDFDICADCIMDQKFVETTENSTATFTRMDSVFPKIRDTSTKEAETAQEMEVDVETLFQREVDSGRLRIDNMVNNHKHCKFGHHICDVCQCSLRDAHHWLRMNDSSDFDVCMSCAVKDSFLNLDRTKSNTFTHMDTVFSQQMNAKIGESISALSESNSRMFRDENIVKTEMFRNDSTLSNCLAEAIPIICQATVEFDADVQNKCLQFLCSVMDVASSQMIMNNIKNCLTQLAEIIVIFLTSNSVSNVAKALYVIRFIVTNTPESCGIVFVREGIMSGLTAVREIATDEEIDSFIKHARPLSELVLTVKGWTVLLANEAGLLKEKFSTYSDSDHTKRVCDLCKELKKGKLLLSKDQKLSGLLSSKQFLDTYPSLSDLTDSLITKVATTLGEVSTFELLHCTLLSDIISYLQRSENPEILVAQLIAELNVISASEADLQNSFSGSSNVTLLIKFVRQLQSLISKLEIILKDKERSPISCTSFNVILSPYHCEKENSSKSKRTQVAGSGKHSDSISARKDNLSRRAKKLNQEKITDHGGKKQQCEEQSASNEGNVSGSDKKSHSDGESMKLVIPSSATVDSVAEFIRNNILKKKSESGQSEGSAGSRISSVINSNNIRNSNNHEAEDEGSDSETVLVEVDPSTPLQNNNSEVLEGETLTMQSADPASPNLVYLRYKNYALPNSMFLSSVVQKYGMNNQKTHEEELNDPRVQRISAGHLNTLANLFGSLGIRPVNIHASSIDGESMVFTTAAPNISLHLEYSTNPFVYPAVKNPEVCSQNARIAKAEQENYVGAVLSNKQLCTNGALAVHRALFKEFSFDINDLAGEKLNSVEATVNFRLIKDALRLLKIIYYAVSEWPSLMTWLKIIFGTPYADELFLAALSKERLALGDKSLSQKSEGANCARKRGSDFSALNTLKPQISTEEFINSKLNEKVIKQCSECLLVGQVRSCWFTRFAMDFPMLLPFKTRKIIFEGGFFGSLRAEVVGKSLRRELWGITEAEDDIGEVLFYSRGLRSKARLRRKRIKVARKDILKSVIKILGSAPPEYGGPETGRMVIDPSRPPTSLIYEFIFGDEPGSGSGPTLEFYTLVGNEFQRRELHMWRDNCQGHTDLPYVSATGGLFPELYNKFPEKHAKRLLLFYVMGKFIARALMDNRIANIPLSAPLLKVLRGDELTFEDISALSPEIFELFVAMLISARSKNSSSNITDNYEQKIGFLGALSTPCAVEDLDLTFTLPGISEEVPLIPGGDQIAVNNLNMIKYVEEASEGILIRTIAPYLRALSAGFECFVSPVALQLLLPNELDLLIRGDDKPLTIQELTVHVQCDHGYTTNSPAVRWFFEILVEMNSEMRKKFFQFLTGSATLPIGGLAALNPRMTIVRKTMAETSKVKEQDQLPSAMTCQNFLKLPNYSSKEQMKQKLYVVLREGPCAPFVFT